MQFMIVALSAALVAIGAGTFKIAAAENCRTGDSALCATDPNCHWDFERRGCYQGAPEPEDPCAVHGDRKICETDVAIGCRWTAEKKKCEKAK